MTFGALSGIFQQAMLNPLLGKAFGTASPTGFGSLTADSIKVALFNDTTTPDKTVAAASSCFNTGVWLTANEVKDVTNWVSGGRALGAKTLSLASDGSTCFQAPALAGAGNVTITNAYGCLVYEDTISTPADQGLCYNSFGGSAQGVTAGTFCVDAGTEIRTARGWLRYDQVRAGDSCLTLNAGTGLAEWQPVESVHVFGDGPHDVIRLEGAGHSSVTTPDHRWPAVTADGIGWYTTSTLPPDAQLLISETERTDKVADLNATPGTADLVWCVQTPNRTWFARRDDTTYFTGNTILWATVGGLTNVVIFNVTV